LFLNSFFGNFATCAEFGSVTHSNPEKKEMKNINQSQWKILTLISLICLLIPFSIYGLWIYVFNLGTTQAERVAIFKDYFPGFLNGRWSTTLLSIIFSLSAIIISSINLKISKKIWKSLNILILLFSSLLLLLNLFSMM